MSISSCRNDPGDSLICGNHNIAFATLIPHFPSKHNEATMGSEASDRMMTLLQELSALKQLDQQSDATPSGSEKKDGSEKKGELRLRQQRCEEITEEMKALAEQKKNSGSSS